jgi:alkylation response protein AidB-like acyl-CoA dehydrogenase
MSKIEIKREYWRKIAKEVAENVVAARASEIDAKGEFPWDIVNVFAQKGLLNLLIPKEYGGGGGDITSYCRVVEEIAHYCVTSSLLIVVQAVGTMPIVISGSAEMKDQFLKSLVKDGVLVCFCLTEPEAGSDSASIRAKAVLEGDHYLINGRKCFISNGGVSEFYTVFARSSSAKKAEGISAFLVERKSRGLSIGKTEDKMGIRGCNTTEVIFEDVKVPKDQRIGVEGEGFWLAMRTLNRSRPGIGAQAVGLAHGALDYVIRFGKEMDWFCARGESNIIKFMIAEMAIEIEAARALVYKAASMIDEKVKGIVVEKCSAMSKYFATDVAMKVTTDAVQIMQWHGLLRDHPVERMMRDAKITQIYEGTNQIQRMVVAHSVLKAK